jgi:hypothetical protein
MRPPPFSSTDCGRTNRQGPAAIFTPPSAEGCLPGHPNGSLANCERRKSCSRQDARKARDASAPPQSDHHKSGYENLVASNLGGIWASLAPTPAGAEQFGAPRGIETLLHLPAINPSLSLGAPGNSPLQEQMREDYATSLMDDQRQLLQQNPSGATLEEREIGQQLNDHKPR